MRPDDLKELVKSRRSFKDIVLDKGLAALGDALVNFAYSLALSLVSGKPTGNRLDNRLLWEALRASGLREKMPKRMSRHELADAVEALLAYGWLSGLISFWDVVGALKEPDLVSSLSELLRLLAEKLEAL